MSERLQRCGPEFGLRITCDPAKCIVDLEPAAIQADQRHSDRRIAERTREALPRFPEAHPCVPRSERGSLATAWLLRVANLDKGELPLDFHAIQSPDVSDGPTARSRRYPVRLSILSFRRIAASPQCGGIGSVRESSRSAARSQTLNHSVTPLDPDAHAGITCVYTPRKIVRMSTIGHESGQKCTLRLIARLSLSLIRGAEPSRIILVQASLTPCTTLANAMSWVRDCDLPIRLLLCCAQDSVLSAFYSHNRTCCPVDT